MSLIMTFVIKRERVFFSLF